MTINIQLRLKRWQEAALAADMPFTYQFLDERTVEISLASLPDEFPYDDQLSAASRLPRLTALRLAQLESFGAKFGVFRPADMRSTNRLNVYSAYDLPIPA